MDRTLPRLCRDCGETKPGTDFNWRKVKGKGPYAFSYCKACYRVRFSSPVEKVKAAARSAQRRADNPNIRRNDALRKYGLDVDSFAQIVEQQGGGCAICGATEDLHVDHCHSVGVVRGVLCGRCNRGLGMFKDDPARLSAAVTYLLRIGGSVK